MHARVIDQDEKEDKQRKKKTRKTRKEIKGRITKNGQKPRLPREYKRGEKEKKREGTREKIKTTRQDKEEKLFFSLLHLCIFGLTGSKVLNA